MTFSTATRPLGQRFRAVLLPLAMAFAGALPMAALPSESIIRERVQDSPKFRASVANSVDAYLDACAQNVDPERERQLTPAAEAAFARCEAALDRMIDAGYAVRNQVLDEYLRLGGSETEVKAYLETASEAFTAWLEATIVSSVIAQAAAEAG